MTSRRRGKVIPLALDATKEGLACLNEDELHALARVESKNRSDARPSPSPSLLDPRVTSLASACPTVPLNELLRDAITSQHGPVLIQGLHVAGGSGIAVLAALEEFSSSPVPVLLSRAPPASSPRFLLPDPLKNAPSSPYHVRDPETKTLSMGSVAEFCSSARSFKSSALCLDLTLLTPTTESESESESRPDTGSASTPTPDSHPGSTLGVGLGLKLNPKLLPPAGSPSTPPTTARLFSALRDILAPVPLLLHSLRLGHVTQGSLVLLSQGDSARGSLLPARYAQHDRLLLALSPGDAAAAPPLRVTVFSPVACFQGLYTYPVAHPYDRYAMPDLERYDEEAWGALDPHKLGPVYRADLTEGSVLFVPAYCPIAVESLPCGTAPSNASSPLPFGGSSSTAQCHTMGRDKLDASGAQGLLGGPRGYLELHCSGSTTIPASEAPTPLMSDHGTDTGPSDSNGHAAGALEVAASRLIEEAAVEAVGVLEARRLLRSISDASVYRTSDPFFLRGSRKLRATDYILRCIDVATVRGATTIGTELMFKAQGETSAGLGKGSATGGGTTKAVEVDPESEHPGSEFSWRSGVTSRAASAFLERMSRLRMLPTPWLNVLHDPLLLGLPARVDEDDRTEEERRYPELFRERIAAREREKEANSKRKAEGRRRLPSGQL